MYLERRRRRGYMESQSENISSAKQLLWGRMQRPTHPRVYVTDKRCVVNTHAVFESHQVWFCHGRVCSIGIQADVFADVCSQKSEVPHLVQWTPARLLLPMYILTGHRSHYFRAGVPNQQSDQSPDLWRNLSMVDLPWDCTAMGHDLSACRTKLQGVSCG